MSYAGTRPPRPSRKSSLPVVLVLYVVALALLAAAYGRTRVASSARAPAAVRLTGRVVSSPRDAVTGAALVRATAEDNPDGYHGFCTGSGFLKSDAALALYIPVVFIMFVGLAIVTDEYFVAALEQICERLHLSEDVAGATFMAAGSSAPELFTSLLAVFVTEDDVGVGTIVGSAVFNILVIIGLSAALAGSVLALDWRPLARDSAFYTISVLLLLVVLLGPSRGEVSWWEGLIMVIGYGLYISFMKFCNKPYMKATERFVKREAKMHSDIDLERGGYGSLTPRGRFRSVALSLIAIDRLQKSVAEPKTFFGVEVPESRFGKIFFPLTFLWSIVFKYTIIDCGKPNKGALWPLTFVLSIAWIGAISYAMVESARMTGCLIGIPSSVMGLTVLAAGTSVPDALASVAVARQGRADMAVSNAIGSNVFDILLGLGLPWFLGGIILRKNQEVTVDPLTVVIVPIAILFVMIVGLVALLMILRWQLRPLLGYVLFGAYFVFVAYQLLDTYVFKIGE